MLDYLETMISDANGGLITYADFIEAALYHPVEGYYMRESEKIGRAGDFITTSNVSDIYGRTFAKWFAQHVKAHGLTPAVCEIGGGNGRFAKAFIEEWNLISAAPLTYRIIETSPYHRRLQREALGKYSGFSQDESLASVSGFKGLIFSNELFDALPVHVIEKKDGIVFEAMVGMEKGRLFEKLVPMENQAIASFLKESGLKLREGQRIEVPLAMMAMIHDISEALQEGLAVTVDYGYSNEEWMHPARKSGSLRGFLKHRMVENILENPGEMDITSHIHFDMLQKLGEKLALKTLGKFRQDEFLIGAGILKELEDNYDPNPFSERSRLNRAIRTLVMPSGMSASFHILIQEKGTSVPPAAVFP